MTHELEKILQRSQRVRHDELKKFLSIAVWTLAYRADRLIRGRANPAQRLGPYDRPGC